MKTARESCVGLADRSASVSWVLAETRDSRGRDKGPSIANSGRGAQSVGILARPRARFPRGDTCRGAGVQGCGPGGARAQGGRTWKAVLGLAGEGGVGGGGAGTKRRRRGVSRNDPRAAVREAGSSRVASGSSL